MYIQLRSKLYTLPPKKIKDKGGGEIKSPQVYVNTSVILWKLIRDSNIFKIAKPLFIVTVIRSFVTHPLLKMKNTFHHRLLQNPNFVINNYTSMHCQIFYFVILIHFHMMHYFIQIFISYNYFKVLKPILHGLQNPI